MDWKSAKERFENIQYSKTKSNLPHDTGIPVTSISANTGNDMHRLEPRQLATSAVVCCWHIRTGSIQGIDPEAILAS